MQDGLGPLLLSWLCDNISKSTGFDTLMFGETATEQNKKQMDLLIRYFDETEEKVVTKFLGCVMFYGATADDICDQNKFGQEERFFSLLPSILAGNFQKKQEGRKVQGDEGHIH